VAPDSWQNAMAAAFLVLGLFLLYQATRLSMRTLDGGPGPGVLPTGLAVLLVLLSARLLLSGWREQPRFGNLRRIGIMVGGVFLYAFILEKVGFVVATALLMIVLMVTFNERYRAAVVTLGVVGTVLTYLLFFNVLKVQLPPDPWGLMR
jgi:putative tricarboxylic transport membrane protein